LSVIGEALLDEEGSVHGWCLDTDAPLTRLTIDILADGEVVASVAASRFREDAQRRGLGDGYCGFSIRLSRQLAASPSLVATAERATGRVFWQKLLRPVPLPGGLPARIEALRATLGGLARSPALTPAPGLAATAAAGFAGLGHALAAHAGAPRLAPSVVLPACANPAVSLILDAGPDTLAALRRAAGGLAGAAAEIILTDDGAGPETLRAQAGFTNLNYLRAPGAGVAQRRNLAIQAARGRVLVLLRGAAGVDAAACAAGGVHHSRPRTRRVPGPHRPPAPGRPARHPRRRPPRFLGRHPRRPAL
jgi:hypothetical protein